jgi:hypothetical protein
MQYDSTGKLTWAPNNLLLNTATLSTQNVTTIAANHVLSFKGTGTVTLSGTSTAGPLVGTGVNDRVNLAFTPTAGTLTLTVSGSVTDARLSRVTYETTMRTMDDVNTTGSIYYGPRFDYNPSTLAARGLLYEPTSRTNLITYSANLSSSYWTTYGAPTESTTELAPDGTNTAYGLTATATWDTKAKSLTVAPSTDYIISGFISKTGATCLINVGDDGSRYVGGAANMFINANTGATSSIASGVQDYDVVSINSDFWFWWVKVTTLPTTTLAFFIWQIVTTGVKVTCWGAQYTAGTFPQSHILTSGATMTRNGDTISASGYLSNSAWVQYTDQELNSPALVEYNPFSTISGLPDCWLEVITI